jgi:hypothetical protein
MSLSGRVNSNSHDINEIVIICINIRAISYKIPICRAQLFTNFLVINIFSGTINSAMHEDFFDI